MRTEASDCGISTLAFYSAPLGLVWFVDVLSPGRCPGLSHSAPLARAKDEGLWMSCPQGDALGYHIRRLWRGQRKKVCGCPVPRAMPWAITFGAFGAGKGKRFVDVPSPGRCPGLSHSAPLARAKDEGLWMSRPQGGALGYHIRRLWRGQRTKVCGCPVPRAVPWAITF